jgi:GNAT superfamily N-acetyltransferase
VAVRDSARREAVGTALVSALLAWGAKHGALEVVAAPSPDGWRLFNTLGFENVPVTPDTCFYWTG